MFSSVAQFCPTLCDPMDYSMPGFCLSTTPGSCSNSCPSMLVMPSNGLILCHSLLLLPSIFPSTRVFSNKSVLHMRQPKYWSFSFSIGLSNECSRLISFRIDWFDLLAIQGTLKSLLQHHNWHSAFFMVQLSHPYLTTRKTIAQTRPLSAKSCLCFLICCVGWSQLFSQGASIF